MFGNTNIDTLILRFNSESDLPIFSERLNKMGYDYKLDKLINPNLLINIENHKVKNLTQYSKSKISLLKQSLSRTYRIILNSQMPLQKVIKFLSSQNEVEFVEVYPKRNTCAMPNDTLFFEQFYMDILQVPEAWDSLNLRRQILVAVVDTGVDYEHPDLAENIWVNPGEDGLDDKGQDKRTNGIDDDGNGFVDDWRRSLREAYEGNCCSEQIDR